MGFDANFCMSSLFDGEDRDSLVSLQNTSSQVSHIYYSFLLYHILKKEGFFVFFFFSSPGDVNWTSFSNMESWNLGVKQEQFNRN